MARCVAGFIAVLPVVLVLDSGTWLDTLRAVPAQIDLGYVREIMSLCRRSTARVRRTVVGSRFRSCWVQTLHTFRPGLPHGVGCNGAGYMVPRQLGYGRATAKPSTHHTQASQRKHVWRLKPTQLHVIKSFIGIPTTPRATGSQATGDSTQRDR